MAYTQVNDGIPVGALPTNTTNNGIPAIVFTPGLASQTAEQKAGEYNRLFGQGFTDAQIRSAADSTFGTQSSSDWDYLTNLARQSTPATGALSQATAVQPTAAEIANTPGMGSQGIGVNVNSGVTVTDEVANSFKSVFGRDPTASELQGLRSTYGMSIEPGEFNQLVLSRRDANVGYGAATTEAVNPVYEQKLVQDGEGGTYMSNVIVGYKDQNGNAVDTSLVTPELDYEGNISKYVIPVAATDFSAEGGIVDKLTNQILGQNLTQHWSGEGYGSAQSSAADMALLLAAAGITDINQFGKVSVAADAAVTPVYATRKAFDPEYGEYEERYITGYTDANGKAVDPSLVRADEELGYVAPVGTKQVFGNKVTGTALDSHYSKANENIFSGTFAGEGSTGYGVQFKEDGTPVFYTQFMGSSNDLAQILEDPLIGSIVQAAASYFGGPLGTAALNLAAGRDIDDVAKATLASFVAAEVGNFVSGAPSVVDALGQTGANIAGRVAGSVASGGGEEGAIQALVTGGVGLAMPEITNMIPGYADLTAGQKSFVNNIVSSTLLDGDLSPSELVNAAVSAGRTAQQAATQTTGNLTNRVYDDTITQAGADAFIQAKGAGASDEDAMAAADAATGVLINKIPDAGPSNAVTTTYGQGSVDTNFGDLEGAIATNAINDATRVQRLDEISNQPKFADAYAQARSLLGPNQTFTWRGKEYSTATAAERPDLSVPSIDALNARNLATVTDASNTVAAQTDTAARDAAAVETANLAAQSAATKPLASTSFLGQIYKDLNEQFRLQGVAANEYLANNPNSPITASVSSAFEAAGELQKNLGGVALALDNKPLADAIISGGSKLQSLGQSIGDGPQDTKNWNDTINLINKASGTEKLAVLAGRVMDGTSGLARQVGLELRQELPALFLGGGLLKPTLIASGLIDTGDTGGAAVVEAYDDVIKRGGTHQEALSAGRKAGGAAAATEAAIQLTLGKLADLGAGKLDNLISKGSAKVAGEGVVEGSQEAGASAAVDLALGNTIDVNKALTQGVLGAAVGKGTAATTSPVDAATSSTTSGAAPAASATGATNLGTVGSVVPGAGVVQDADLGAIGSVTPGADAAVGAQNTISVADAQQTAADLGLNVSDDVAVSLATKIDAANNSGNDVSITSDANTVTINDATANTKTTVDASTGTTTVVDSNANTTSQTKVDGNIQTTVVADANANTNTQTTVNNNTNTTTSTTVDTNTNVTTQTTITADTQTTVLTDPNTGTQTTVKVNVNTGDVIDVKETEIPTDWTPPVINPPKIDTPPSKAAPNEPEESPSKANLKLPNKGGAGGAGGIGASLPLGIDVDPASLRSRVTEGAIDPLARVKQAQAEFERDVMMNQMDPRFLAAIQQRTNPQQAVQPEGDIGALAKLLRGDSEAPANEGKYYAYGSEDSIDDILGGRAANYAAGGYVEPLKASGGSMALPLLAKSGGALGKYNGREDFKDGKHVAGDGDGQSDDIPAWLADGEFVFPADVVSALGNGSTKAGTDKLYEMMHSIRDRARSKGPKDLPPPALKSPLDYLKSSKRSK